MDVLCECLDDAIGYYFDLMSDNTYTALMVNDLFPPLIIVGDRPRVVVEVLFLVLNGVTWCVWVLLKDCLRDYMSA